MIDAVPARPRITFGIIVLDGEPFTAYTLRSLYAFAHEIIVVEGAAPGARNIATPDGHSRDGTLETLRRFKAEEDPDDKVTIVTAEDAGHPDGFWPGEKDEQSGAYAARATGDYLWQVDIDEFYTADEMTRIVDLLATDPTIEAMTFRQTTYWGALEYVCDGWYLRRGAADYHRLFRWRPGYVYATHRPPTVLDETGRDLRTGHWLDADATVAAGFRLYHYSLLLPKQVIEKCDYYATAEWAKRSGAIEWANDAWLSLHRPFRVHNVYAYPSWLERYNGSHPDEICRMMDDLRASGGPIALRPTADIERLLDSRGYRVRRAMLMRLEPWDALARRVRSRARRLARRPVQYARRGARAARRRLSGSGRP
jgi:hypothetical protein